VAASLSTGLLSSSGALSIQNFQKN